MSDDRLERIEIKLDKISDRIASIDVTLAGQHAQLTEHIKRSDLLETKLEPIEQHVASVQGAGKLIKWIAIISTAIIGVAKVLKII